MDAAYAFMQVHTIEVLLGALMFLVVSLVVAGRLASYHRPARQWHDEPLGLDNMLGDEADTVAWQRDLVGAAADFAVLLWLVGAYFLGVSRLLERLGEPAQADAYLITTVVIWLMAVMLVGIQAVLLQWIKEVGNRRANG